MRSPHAKTLCSACTINQQRGTSLNRESTPAEGSVSAESSTPVEGSSSAESSTSAERESSTGGLTPPEGASSAMWLPLAMGAVSGTILFLADFPVHFWWLQVIALFPWLWALAKKRPGWVIGALSGAVLGLFYNGALAIVLEFPWLMTIGLVTYLTFFWALFGMGAALLFRNPAKTPGGTSGVALGVACAGVMVEWLNVSLIPVWGTAQVFTRVWSAFPPAVQIVSVTGVLGLVWLMVALPALGAYIPIECSARSGVSGGSRVSGDSGSSGGRGIRVSLVVITVGVVLGNYMLWPRKIVGELKVAAVGWTHKDLPLGVKTHWRWTWKEICQPSIAEASEKGARLVVTPEVGLWVPKEDVEEFRKTVMTEARKRGVFLAVGWFDEGSDKNRMIFVDAEGRVLGGYAKSHLIMGLEDYKPGEGVPVVVKLGRYRVGGMICQDDNFTDLSRGYGRRRTHLTAVPTNDWAQVADYHFENSIFRGVESRYAIVRAATNGHSAIVSARGEVLARVDHFTHGPSVVVARTPLYSPGSFYSRAGNWIVIPCALWLFIIGFFRFRSYRYSLS